MNKLIIILFTIIALNASAQTNTEKPLILYGVITKQDLQPKPFSKWFDTGYNAYKPNEIIAGQLKRQNLKDISVKIFFGIWCGDSQREVPRFLKLLNEISFDSTNIQLIAVGKSDSLYKQSPQHEEKGLGIYRVPTIIVYKKGVEINRINEFPVMSLEKDLLAITTNQPYTPNYRSFALINKWLADGALADANISANSLAQQLKPLINNENELNSLGYVLLALGNKKEALKIFKANYNLYFESSNISSSLGEGFYENGDNANAVFYLENALRLNKRPEDVKGILEILYKAKGVK